MKKFFREFKIFIARGNVVDLAVGMIIGAAFTAIVTALVKNIFQPLINTVPMGNFNGLITMLVAKDASGVVTSDPAHIDMSKSIYIDWGAFIMAVVDFVLTAFVLFLIVKAINALRGGTKTLKSYKLSKEDRAEMKATGLTVKQMRVRIEERNAALVEAERKKAEQTKPETVEQILCDIRELLKKLESGK